MIRSGRILAAGGFSDLRLQFDSCPCIDHPDTVLMPGLINAHVHLELSHLQSLGRSTPPATFTGWIEKLLAARLESPLEEQEILEAAAHALDRLHRSGVIAVADIGNSPLGRSLQGGYAGVLLHFTEYLGLSRAGLLAGRARLAREADHHACTAHAPYSVHPELLRLLKQRANSLGFLFPIHVAETGAEIEMIREGRGELIEFLRRRGFWDNTFQPTGIDNTGSVQYLHQVGLLDDGTLCVHAVHVSSAEIELMAASQAKICLCPGSNRFLGVGRPPVAAYLEHGMLPALGTDSLASNPELSIWREMRLLAEEHAEVAPADILAMATLGGAQALHVEQNFGSLETGKRADILAVCLPAPVKNGSQLLEFLVNTGGCAEHWWLTEG